MLNLVTKEGYNSNREVIQTEIEVDGVWSCGGFQVKPGVNIAVVFGSYGIMLHECGTVILVPEWLRECIINMPPSTDRICTPSSLEQDGNDIQKDIAILAAESYKIWPRGEYARAKPKIKKLKKTKKRKV